MRLTAVGLLAALAVVAGAAAADARPYYGSDRPSWTRQSAVGGHAGAARQPRAPRAGGEGGRPAKWCGWWMRTQKGGGPEYNLARNWSRWGSPTGPQVGAVVVWRHHVGIITGRAANGQWIVKSGNDSGRVRERARSVAGAVFRI